MIISVFANQKESEEDFYLYLRMRKAKIAFRDCSTASPFGGSMHHERPGETCITRPTTLSISASRLHSFDLGL